MTTNIKEYIEIRKKYYRLNVTDYFEISKKHGIYQEVVWREQGRLVAEIFKETEELLQKCSFIERAIIKIVIRKLLGF